MVWLSRSAPERSNQRRSYRQSIELPIAVSVRGLPAPVYGTLINISETGCRLRSLILLDRNRIIEFELNRPGSGGLKLRGRVLSRATPQSDAGYEYGVAFEEIEAGQRELLGREIAEMQRRAASARVAARESAKYVADGGKQRRTSVRTVFSVPVRYRPVNRSASVGEASDISAGGLRLMCPDSLAIGSDLEIRFTLPSNVLNVYPTPEGRLEITPFGQRRVHVPDNRRPFVEMAIRGRILARYEAQQGRECYGVAFTDIDGYQREEIARFTHAVQLARIRNNG
ncbi:MAG TPA: PilZ domain-containing protein [Candidatus Baltobacteraceae bacterium]|jgi:c-di-GMP-binding flagellar brake protein YcgR|nr:PilZ domain-containing protein [Candidatus Baltobacteraceae bacterium]